MSSDRGRIWSFLVVGAGIALAACTGTEPLRQPPQATGTAGTGGVMIPPPDAGAVNPTGRDGGAVDVIGGGRDGGGTTCVGGTAAPLPILPGMGIPPQIPSTLTHATEPVPALSGGTLLALSDGTSVAASDPERDRVYVVDTATRTVRATVSLSAGDEPGRLAEDAAGRVHVALRRGGAVVTLDPKTGTVSARRVVCSAPRGLAYQKNGDQLHVACAGGELVSLPAAGGVATRTLTLERDLRDVVVKADGSLLVSTFRKAQVLTVSADGQLATARLVPGSGAVPSVMGPLQNRTPSVAWRMLPLDETAGSVVMLHQTGVTDLIDPAAGGYAGIKGCGGIVQPGVSVLTPGQSSPQVASGIGNLTLAIDIALSPDHQKVAFAVAGNTSQQGPGLVETSVQAVTPTTPSPCPIAGNAITTQPPGQVVAVSYSTAGVLFAQTREPSAIWRADTGVAVALASDSRVDTGQFLFHVNAGGGLACASCHPEGGEDGRVWNFVCAGARRTQSIRGSISATAPFHWDGAETDFSHLMDDVFSARMAGPKLTSEQKQVLQSWIDTIPEMPATAGLDASAVGRGKLLFEDTRLGCATCHTGALLTNNATVDVGTGQPLQVPSLRGVSWRAPFMHDGCAATLADRFAPACGGGDTHGVTSTLAGAQIADLTAYLQSL
jgi:mono/diheme cytochrome c family protein